MEEYVYNSSEWKPLTATLVEYPVGDPFGKFLAVLALFPLGVTCGFIALILFRRDLHTIAFFLGIFLNETFNMALKFSIQEPRPAHRDHLYTKYGMPSSHAQFMLFFTTYTVLFVIKRLNHISPLDRIIRVLVISVCFVTTGLVCYGRIYLLYHTWAQVIVGSIIGTLTGTLWFLIVHLLLTPIFPYIVSWKISELFLLRDTTLIPNILWFEYTATRQETRARQRKLISMKSQ